MKKLLVFISAIGLICCDNEKEITTGTLTVSGLLTNGTAPVANATVDIDDLVQYKVRSDVNGFFEIKNVSSGKHTLNYEVSSDTGAFSKVSDTLEVNEDVFLESLTLPDPVILNEAEIQRSLESNEVSLSWNKYQLPDFREYKLYQHSSSGLDETTGELLHVATIANDTLFSTMAPHSSETFFRVFVRDNFGLYGGSNIIDVSIGPYESEPELAIGVQSDFFLSENEEQELYFDTLGAGIYSIAWFDSWFDDYDAGSIVVSAYNEDKSTYYFQNERLIQMNGSPFSIYVGGEERVYMNIEHFDDRFPGSYGVKITSLGEETSLPLTIGEASNISIDLGEVKMAHFEALANKEYEIIVGSTVNGGAMDDGTQTHISIYEESSDSFSIYKEAIPFPCCGGTKTFNINPGTQRKVYLVIDGAYWFKQNTVDILINEL